MTSVPQPDSIVRYPVAHGPDHDQCELNIAHETSDGNGGAKSTVSSTTGSTSRVHPCAPELSATGLNDPNLPAPPILLEIQNPPLPLPQPRQHVPHIPYTRADTVAWVPRQPQPSINTIETQQRLNPYPFHGPLQAERFAYSNEVAAKRLAASELKKAKDAEKAAEKLAKEEKKRAEREEKEAKKRAEKEAKEAQRLAEKQAKEAERIVAKEKKVRGKSNSTRGRRAPGDSDDEINHTNPDEIKSAAIQPITKMKRTGKWTDDESLKAIRHIVSTSVWRTFKLKQTLVFREISEAILLGSKDAKQVANFWHSCWKKFKACRRRENHTGGGDGDELAIDAMREEVDSEPESGTALSGDEAKQATNKEHVDGTKPLFSDTQLNRFEQSDIYQLILKVAENHPEVIKDEEFDSARPLSDSEDEVPTRHRKRSAESDADMDLALKTYEIISASISSFGETRKANLELAHRRDLREEKAERDRLESLQKEHELSQMRFDLERQAHAWEIRRIELEERHVRLEERERRRQEWVEVKEMLKSGIEELVDQGKRMARRLQAEEDKEYTNS